MNLRAALNAARTRLDATSDSPGLDAQLLLAHVLEATREYLFTYPERELSPAEMAAYVTLVQRRASGEPVAYLLGRRAWYDRDFAVTSAVLIPRPETELLLEQALAWVDAHPGELTAADIGTGSGAIAVTLAALRPQVRVIATDISPLALDVARRNAAEYTAPVTFWQGDLTAPLRERDVRADLLLSNPPYIATDELPALAVSRHEPRLALDGGTDGLALIERLLSEAPDVCAPGALVLVEIGAGQGHAAWELALRLLPARDVRVLPDLAGHDRLLRAELE